ncbi:MAG: phosphoribosylformylglycinamidine synthase subunit PurS [bacterium]|nr:phosphoribosylformylglycinamidine synthase subunit PurS [bacterium]
MAISIIAAVAKNGVIGNKGKLPWHLPKDMAYFAKTTKGHPVIMGRKTFESMEKKPLPGRTNIIVTSRVYAAPGCLIAHTVGEALFYAKISPHAEDIFIIGGSLIYREALAFAERLYITAIDRDFEGDVFFPKVDFSRWKETFRVEEMADEENDFRYSYVVYDKLSEKEYKNNRKTFSVVIDIALKNGILDPQGKAIMQSLHMLGFEDVESVCVGKRIELTVRGTDEKEIKKNAETMCKKLLANPVIEQYEIKVV